jgi:hypothetical protein
MRERAGIEGETFFFVSMERAVMARYEAVFAVAVIFAGLCLKGVDFRLRS